MSRKKKARKANSLDDLRLNPDMRVSPKFDPESIALYPTADRKEMGMRVRDNCAEENIK